MTPGLLPSTSPSVTPQLTIVPPQRAAIARTPDRDLHSDGSKEVLEHATEFGFAADRTISRRSIASAAWCDIADALMRPLRVVVVDEFTDEIIEMALADDNEVIQALVLARASGFSCTEKVGW